jgi:hypothetical protein
MRFSSSTNRPLPVVIAFALAMTVLLAQWIGLHHGIRHAEWQHSLASTQPVDEESAVFHSCLIFDAATLADSISLNPYVAPLLTGIPLVVLWAAFASWDAPLSLHFSSRAPPLP